MFGFKEHSSGSSAGETGWENVTDEDLLHHYKERQRLAKSTIEDRDHPDQFEIRDPKTEQPVSREEKQERMQDLVEIDFSDLNRLRAEIERRGLKVPTLEEQEKSN